MSGGSVAVKNGAAFEEQIDVFEHLMKNTDSVAHKDIRKWKGRKQSFGYIIYNNGKKFRQGTQTEFAKILEADYKKPLGSLAYLNANGSDKKIPDSFIMDEKNKKLIIFEMKNQTEPGSVEEKIKGVLIDINIYRALMDDDWKIVFYLIGNWWFAQVKHLITFRDVYNLYKNVYVYIESLPNVERLGFVPKKWHEYKPVTNPAKTVDEMRQAIVELYMRIVPKSFSGDLYKMLYTLKTVTDETIITDAYHKLILHDNSNILPEKVANGMNLSIILENKTEYTEKECERLKQIYEQIKMGRLTIVY